MFVLVVLGVEWLGIDVICAVGRRGLRCRGINGQLALCRVRVHLMLRMEGVGRAFLLVLVVEIVVWLIYLVVHLRIWIFLASPRNCSVLVHLYRMMSLLTLENWVHHEFFNLAVDH